MYLHIYIFVRHKTPAKHVGVWFMIYNHMFLVLHNTLLAYWFSTLTYHKCPIGLTRSDGWNILSLSEYLGCHGVSKTPFWGPFRGVTNGGSGVSVGGVKILRVDWNFHAYDRIFSPMRKKWYASIRGGFFDGIPNLPFSSWEFNSSTPLQRWAQTIVINGRK